MKIADFFANDYTDFATYDNYRNLGSYIDGLKPSMRKIVHVFDKNNITTPTKVEQLQSKIAEQTEYLHGSHTLAGVIVNMSTSYPGTNNMPLLLPKGNFGTRCVQRAAAGRYIYASKAPAFSKLFRAEDRPILIEQEFEGTIIEPRFFLPVLPLLLVNGSEGIGNGYSQKILPRDPKLLAKLVFEYLTKGKLPKNIPPYFEGFQGTVSPVEDNPGSWVITGCLEKTDRATLRITEVPVGYDLEGYTKKLDDLEEKKVIKGYTDRSDGKNKICFDVRVDLEFMRKPLEWQLAQLKLTRKFSETYTCLDENNGIREFESEVEILKAYCDFRVKQYDVRKAYIEGKLKQDIGVLKEKARFVELVVTEKIKIFRMTKVYIEEQCEKHKLSKKDGSYNYLTGLPIHSLTEEKIDELKAEVVKKEEELDCISKTPAQTMWINDIKEAVK